VDAEPCIRGDFYAPAYGPTVLLKLVSTDAAQLLRDAFLRLAAGEPALRLYPHPSVSLEHVSRIDLRVVLTPPGKHFRRAGAAAFTWEATTGEWATLADLVQPFLQGEAGHQYLTSEVADDALVTISFGEDHPHL